MFIDEIKVVARAGHGGKGSVAFLREAFRPKGGPAGGNGGRGGSVILQADHDLNNLIAQFFQPRLLAEHGHHGKGRGMDGRAGSDLLVKVPCGTIVWRLPPDDLPTSGAVQPAASVRATTPSPRLPASSSSRPVLGRSPTPALSEDTPRHARHAELQWVADLTEHEQQFVLCRGGRGGMGNRNFATATRQTPRFAQPGEPGEEGTFLLELRMMADVGLVGYPNAGKSTLLTAISRARPKVAPYPFTTLHPQIGIVEYEDWHRLVVCDVPGLIAGAHRNAGLGHSFLRHIERCRALLLLLDMAGTDGRAPWDDYHQLLSELELYDPALLRRPRLVVANKMDEPTAEANLRKFKRRVPRTPVLPISAAFDDGLAPLLKKVRETVAAP